MERAQTDVDEPKSSDEEPAQIYVRTTRGTLRAFKRLADRKEKTLSQWVLDVLWNEVEGDLDELRRSIDDAEQKAQREIKAEKEMLASLERDSQRRVKERNANPTSKKSGVRRLKVPT